MRRTQRAPSSWSCDRAGPTSRQFGSFLFLRELSCDRAGPASHRLHSSRVVASLTRGAHSSGSCEWLKDKSVRTGPHTGLYKTYIAHYGDLGVLRQVHGQVRQVHLVVAVALCRKRS